MGVGRIKTSAADLASQNRDRFRTHGGMLSPPFMLGAHCDVQASEARADVMGTFRARFSTLCDYFGQQALPVDAKLSPIDSQQLTTANSISKSNYQQHSKDKQMAAQTDSLRKFAVLTTKAKMHAKAEELWQRLVDANNEDGAARYNLMSANQLWENWTLP